MGRLQPDIAYIGHLNHLSTGIVDVLEARHIPMVFMLHDYWLMCPRGQFLCRSIGREDNFLLCHGQQNRACAENCYAVYFSGIPSERETDVRRWEEWVARRMQECRGVVGKVNRFIAPARYLRNRFVEGFGIPSEQIDYLDYGFPLAYLRPVGKQNDGHTFIFGYIGTHIPAKGG